MQFALENQLFPLLAALHFGDVPEIRFVAVVCGLLALSHLVIGPIVSSIFDEMNQKLLEWFGWFSERKPEPTTASMTVSELQKLNTSADNIQVRLDEATRIQGNLLTDNVNLAADLAGQLMNKDQKLTTLKADSESSYCYLQRSLEATEVVNATWSLRLLKQQAPTPKKLRHEPEKPKNLCKSVSWS